MRVLVTGGAGYIGSAVSAYLLDNDFEVTILDDLSTGNKSQIDPRAEFVQGDILEKDDLDRSMSGCFAVVHFAGKAIVSDSVENPSQYYLTNTEGTLRVLDGLLRNNITKLVFSSTCAVYGTPTTGSINEFSNTNPINPYGESKLKADSAISSQSKRHKLESYSFRFFNVSGAYTNSDGHQFGEMHAEETHLIPRVFNSKNISVYGSNWPTPDGTCIRDYLHVYDIATAVRKAILISKGYGHYIYNLGLGRGYSVLEMVRKIEKITGTPIKYSLTEKREGDPGVLVSDSSLAKNELGWRPEKSIDEMIEDSYNFYKLTQGK